MASKLLQRSIKTCTSPHLVRPTTSTTYQTTTATYTSRAHPRVRPTTPITEAIQTILTGMDDRHVKRSERWEKNKPNRVDQRVAYFGARGAPGCPSGEEVRAEAEKEAYRRMDESLELALQLNLDPRKPGQALRGSMALPHGNGKTFNVAVFTDDPTVAQKALDAGAIAAGGATLIDEIQNGQVSITAFERTLASPEMMPQLSVLARLLGPRGLMPNPKLNTIVDKDGILEALDKQRSGMSTYRTDRSGIIRLAVGKGSFGMDKLVDNVREMMNEMQAIKPESFGKGKKGQKKVAKGAKYYLKAHLSSTQSRGSVLVDLSTLDPTSSFFMSDPQ